MCWCGKSSFAIFRLKFESQHGASLVAALWRWSALQASGHGSSRVGGFRQKQSHKWQKLAALSEIEQNTIIARAGQLLREMEKAKGGEQYHKSTGSPQEPVQTLAKLGRTS
jgi:hypothetical protein